MKYRISGLFVVLIIAFLFFPQVISAQTPNNKFGIHIIDENDLQDAANLVNSNGGEWGYVTVVIREDQRDSSQWQRVFDHMRRLKLIPIVRLATKNGTGSWQVPQKEEATNWAAFLNGLNWPIKNRYVVLFNEPNHDHEWGGAINPAEYAQIARHYYEILDQTSEDFYILPAALDLAASNTPSTMEASEFFERMHNQDNFIFTLFDGLNSHSYPNPGFSGSPHDSGKSSVRGYLWEISYLANFGFDPESDVFITETGWVLKGNPDELTKNYLEAYKNAWDDERIVAITPFLLNYLNPPFDSFSWKNPQTGEYYPFYTAVRDLPKTKGEPTQLHSYEFIEHNVPEELVLGSTYTFSIILKNTGQSIWSHSDGFSVHYSTSLPEANVKIDTITQSEPFQETEIKVKISTNGPLGNHLVGLQLNKDGNPIGKEIKAGFTIIKPPRLTMLARSWFGDASTASDYSLEMYKDNELQVSIDHLLFTNGIAHIDALYDIIPNRVYQLVLKKPAHAASRREVFISKGTTIVDFGRLAPLDFNMDGKIDLKDIAAYSATPLQSELKISPF